MSAFVVSDQTISNCVSAIADLFDPLWGIDSTAPAIHTMMTKLGPFDTGDALLRMNIRAVSRRYEDAEDGLGAIAPRPDRRPVASACPFQKYKSLLCLGYQCSEGDIPKTTLFRELEVVIHSFAKKIVQDDPRYDAAEWDPTWGEE